MNDGPSRIHETSPTEWLQCCGGVIIALAVFTIAAKIVAAFLWLVMVLTIIAATLAAAKNYFTGKPVFNQNDEQKGDSA